MPNKTLTIEQVLNQLAETPRGITALTTGLEPILLRTTPANGGWSANEILAHLRACADVWGAGILAIITQDTPTLRAVNPRTWIQKTDYLEQEFHPSLRAFAAQRGELLAVLQALPPAGWSRTAIVTGAGSILEWDVLFYARRLASHERTHVNQIERMLGPMHREHLTPSPSPAGR